MRRSLEIAFLAAWVTGCGNPSYPEPILEPVADQLKSSTWEGTVATVELPLLRFNRQDGEDVLLGYKLTEAERKLFKEMDTAVVSLTPEASLETHHDTVARIGTRYGLTRSQSIAFWTRATFSMFEP